MSVTPLLTRLQALERTVASLQAQRQGSEAISPNYLTIDPVTGLISAQFNGLIVGSVQLPEGNGSAFNGPNSVYWVDAGGTTRAFIQGYLGGGQHRLLVDAPDVLELNAAADITLNGNVLLSSSGQSIFPQLPGGFNRTQTLGGSLGAGSTLPAGSPSGGFTVSKTSVGNYTISFTNSFLDIGYWLGLAVEGSATSNHKIVENSRAAGSVGIALSAADVATDLGWSFLCMGIW